MVDPDQRQRLEAAKRASALQLMFRCARRLNDEAIGRMRATPGLEGLRAAHTNLFPHIDLEGTRLTEVATRAGISKQAVAQQVDELVEMGALERVSDPTDGRAKLIRFAIVDGAPSIARGLMVLGEVEQALAAEIGERRMTELQRILLRIDAWLDEVED